MARKAILQQLDHLSELNDSNVLFYFQTQLKKLEKIFFFAQQFCFHRIRYQKKCESFDNAIVFVAIQERNSP